MEKIFSKVRTQDIYPKAKPWAGHGNYLLGVRSFKPVSGSWNRLK